jgi:integrase
MEWEDLDMEFYDGFVHYLIKKGYAKNTIGARVKNLKVFCNAAYARKVHSSTDYSNFKKPTEESYNIYLNEKELTTIFELDLTQNPHLDRARDTFIIGCWTGCRYSDLHKVSEDNIRDGSIYMEQQKTQNRVIVPIHNMVKLILEKYNGTAPSKISNQKFNEYIKKVCEKAELTDKISKGITKGGKRKTEVKEKWEMVASHTMRRSFATNLYKSGFPSISIMAITGHKSEKAFYSYIKVNEEEHAEMLRRHWEKQQTN